MTYLNPSTSSRGNPWNKNSLGICSNKLQNFAILFSQSFPACTILKVSKSSKVPRQIGSSAFTLVDRNRSALASVISFASVPSSLSSLLCLDPRISWILLAMPIFNDSFNARSDDARSICNPSSTSYGMSAKWTKSTLASAPS